MPRASIEALLNKYKLILKVELTHAPVTGSFWGDSEAGIVANTVYVRSDTPIRCLLHEASHAIWMSEDRRSGLDRDAGGDDLEEAAVCYLQIVLADELDEVGRDRLMLDMDTWGYSFRLGSARRWFAADAEDASAWLLEHGLINDAGSPTFKLRDGV